MRKKWLLITLMVAMVVLAAGADRTSGSGKSVS